MSLCEKLEDWDWVPTTLYASFVESELFKNLQFVGTDIGARSNYLLQGNILREIQILVQKTNKHQRTTTQYFLLQRRKNVEMTKFKDFCASRGFRISWETISLPELFKTRSHSSIWNNVFSLSNFQQLKIRHFSRIKYLEFVRSAKISILKYRVTKLRLNKTAFWSLSTTFSLNKHFK